jgi:hypothetical protein
MSAATPPWFVRPLVWTALGCAHLARALGRLTRRVIAPAATESEASDV